MLHLLMLPVLALLGTTQEKDNPPFQFWKDFKAGSWTKIRMEVTQGEQKMLMEDTATLLEVTAEKVVIEHKTMTKIGDREIPGTRKEEIPAKKERVPQVEKTGDEEVEIGGKKIKCEVYSIVDKPAGNRPTIRVKAWVSKDIPGGSVKAEMTPDGQEKPTGFSTVVEWEKK